jgi:hypothetical protein
MGQGLYLSSLVFFPAMLRSIAGHRTGALRTSENSVQAEFEEYPFHAVTRYSAVCAAHPQGQLTSENSAQEKF